MKLRTSFMYLAAAAFVGVSTMSFAGSVGSSARVGAGHGTYHPTTPNDSVLYDNGGEDNVNAYTINSGFSVSDSFDIAAPSTLNSVTFNTWLFPGDSNTNVDWAITTAPFGGSTLGSGTATLSSTDLGLNVFGFDVMQNTFSLGGINVDPGTYYLQLGNLVVSFGDPGFWSESNGPSFACQSGNGLNCEQIPSEVFSISGTTQGGGGGVPEPSSLILLGTGLLGAAGALRRKLNF